MLGEKKTLPFWRRRRANLLALERALATKGVHGERHTDAERAVIGHKLAARQAEILKGKVGQKA